MDRFFRRNALFGLIEIVGRIPLLVTIGYLAKAVGPDVYADWALLMASVGVIAGLTLLGLGSAITRVCAGAVPSVARGYLLYALRLTVPTGAAAGLLVALARHPIGDALGVRSVGQWLFVLSGLLIVSLTVEVLLGQYFKARERLRQQAVLVLGGTSLDVAGAILLFGTDVVSTDPETRLALYIGFSVLPRLLVLYPLLILAGPRLSAPPSGPQRAAFVRYGLPLIPAGLVLWFTTQGDRLVLGHTVSHAELGWYAFGGSLAWNVSYLGLAVFPLLLPRASTLYDEGSHDAVVRLFATSQWVFFSLFAAGAVAIALLADDIIDVTAGARFAPAAPILILLALSVGLERLLGIFEFVFHILKRTSLVLAFNLINMTAQLVAVLVVARMTGDIVAVGWAVLGVTLVVNVLRYAIARRLYAARLPARLVGAIALAGGAVALAAEFASRLPLGVRLGGALGVGLAGLAGAAAGAGVTREGLRTLARSRATAP